jgi:hypothetical protein
MISWWDEYKIKGKYRHYKGGLYKVLGTVTHTETGKTYIVYKALYGNRKERKKVWIRTWDDFFTWGLFFGKRQYRFEKVPTTLQRLRDWWV